MKRDRVNAHDHDSQVNSNWNLKMYHIYHKKINTRLSTFRKKVTLVHYSKNIKPLFCVQWILIWTYKFQSDSNIKCKQVLLVSFLIYRDIIWKVEHMQTQTEILICTTKVGHQLLLVVQIERYMCTFFCVPLFPFVKNSDSIL